MLTQLTIGQYFPARSPLHELDPRTKIIAVIIAMTALFVNSRFGGYGVFSILILLAIALSRVPLALYLRSIKPLWVIILITVVVNLLATPGNVVWQYRALMVTEEGINQSFTMAVRLVLLILLSALLTFTTSPIALTDGLERLLKPFRSIGVPAHELAMMMTIALRFIPLILEETEKIMKAQTARGADFAGKNLFKRAANMLPILVPLFVSSFRRADELALAMEARCYRGGQGRTSMKQYRMETADYLALLIVMLLLIAALVWRWWG